MPNDLPQLRIPVSENARRQLKVVAAQRGISIAELVRTAVQNQLQQEGIEVDLSEGLDTWGGAGRKSKDDE